MTKRRLLSLLLVLAMVLGLGMPAYAAKSGDELTVFAYPDRLRGASELNVTELSANFDLNPAKLAQLQNAKSNIRSAYKDSSGRTEEETEYIESVIEALATPVGALGFDSVTVGAQIDIIVWLQELPTALAEAYGTARAAAAAPYAAEGIKARSSLKLSMSRNITWEYTDVFAGFAMTVAASDVEKIAAMPGVYAVIPDTMMYADTGNNPGYTPDPDYGFEGMKESREIFSIAEIHEKGITGEGVIVGVLDTGIDYYHPDFAGVYKGGYNFIDAKVDYGRSVLGEAADSPMETTYAQWLASGQPELSSNGSEYYTSHGSHVSGTIAAQALNDATEAYKALGLAPDVDLWVARVLGPYGSGATTGIIAAVEDFSADGGNLPKADVINLSLGSFQGSTAYGADIFALNNAVLADVNVAVSAGNNAAGDNGNMDTRKTLTLGSPGTAYLPVTVAASQYGGTAVKSYEQATISSDNGEGTISLLIEGQDISNTFADGQIGGSPSPEYLEGLGYEVYASFYAFTGAGGAAAGNEGSLYQTQLNAIPDDSLAGKVLFVNRGIDFTFYLATAIRTGAGALVVVNRDEAFITNMVIGGTNADHMPVFSAPNSARLALIDLMTGDAAVYLELGALTVADHEKLPAYFSSIGPVTETIGIKPDIIAPGWNILSTQPAFIVNANHNAEDYSAAYASMGGTSMSAPHIAGILALMVQRYPKASPAEIKARLMNTAKVDFIDALGDGTDASVFEVGAGFVDPYRALITEFSKNVYVTVADDIPGETNGTVIEDQTLSSLSFGIMNAGEESRSLDVTVHGAADFTVSVSYNDNTRYSNAAAANGVTLEVGEAEGGTFAVCVAASEEAEDGLYEGYLTITVDGSDYSLPWAVLVGEPLALPFDVLATAERPILSSSIDPSVNTAYDPMYYGWSSTDTTLWFTWQGEWPTDSNGYSDLDLVLLDADTLTEAYYGGYVTMNGLYNDGTALYSVRDFVSSQMVSLETLELEDVANGAYIIGVIAGDEIYGYLDIGVVVTDGLGDMAVQLELPEDIAVDSDPSVTSVTLDGRAYSPALALAAEYEFIWTDALDFWVYDEFYAIDQSFNILAFEDNSMVNIYGMLQAAGFGASNYVYTGDGYLWRCDADGYFDITLPVTQQDKDGGYPFSRGTNHSIVGVEAFYLNTYQLAYPMPAIGANKSAAVTPQYRSVVPAIDEIALENGALAVTMSDAPNYLDENEFDLSFTLDGEENAIETEYTYNHADGTAVWSFEPIENLQTEQALAAAISFRDGEATSALLTIPAVIDYTAAFSIDSETANANDTITADVSISGYANYAAYELTVAYDETLVSFAALSDEDAAADTSEPGIIVVSKEIPEGEAIEEAYVLGLDFTVNSDIADTDNTVFALVDAEVSGAEIFAYDAYSTYIEGDGEAAVDVYNLTVTLDSGIGVEAIDETAYVRYNESGLYTSNSYDEAFVVPAPVAEYGYALKDMVWWNEALDLYYFSEELEGIYFTESMSFTALADEILLDEITLSESSLDLFVAQTGELEATIIPSDALDTSITWSSSDETVVTVDQEGLLTAVSAGAAQIIATSNGNPDISATCDVTVTSIQINFVSGTGVEEIAETAYAKYGEAGLFANDAYDEAFVIPAPVAEYGYTLQDPVWWNNAEEARFTDAEIEAMVFTDDTTFIAQSDVILVDEITLLVNDIGLFFGQTGRMDATVSPSNALDPTFTWSSSDESIITIDEDGFVTTVGVGRAQIYATSNGNPEVVATCDVLVDNIRVIFTSGTGVESINKTACLIYEENGLYTSETFDEAFVIPVPVAEYGYTLQDPVWWNEEDEAFYTAEEIAALTFTGHATFTALADEILLDAINLDKLGVDLFPGETAQLTVSFTPDNALNKDLVWSTSNAGVAIVDQNGLIVAQNIGSALITVQSALNPAITISCLVNVFSVAPPVVPPVTGDTEPTTPEEPTKPEEPTTPEEPVAPPVPTVITESTVNENGGAVANVSSDAIAESLTQAAEEESGTIVIGANLPEGTEAGDIQSMNVSIPADAAQSITEAGVNLTVETPVASVTLDTKTLETIAAAGNGDVSISIDTVSAEALAENLSEEELAAIGNRPVFNFNIKNGDETVSDFGGGSVNVSIPYTLGEDENPNAVVVYYIDSEGNLKTVRGKYNAATGTVDFVATHFSSYAVAYKPVSFTDVPAGHKNKDAIDFIAAREITLGIGGGLFNPEGELKRAEFLVMMMRAYGIEEDLNPQDNFSDAGDDYYTGFLAAAKRLGISDGVGNNMFAPKETLTRQMMFRFLYNILNYLGELPAAQKDAPALEDYSDADEVADWALEAVEILIEAGVIAEDDGLIAPTREALRAEMAQSLYNLLK